MPLQLPSEDPYPLGPGLYSTDPFNKNPLFRVKSKEKGEQGKDLYVKVGMKPMHYMEMRKFQMLIQNISLH